ncbi:hypothetical protein ACYSNW_12320 [Enterococcus sp. LJL99]
MLNINYLITGVMILIMGLFIYLLYFSFNIFYLEKVKYPIKNKKRLVKKRQFKQYRARTEKILRGSQLIIGLTLFLLLLITFIILKVESHSNQLLQSNYNVLNEQKKLEKKIKKQDQMLDKLIHLTIYPEEGLSSFKINSDDIWQDSGKQAFIENLSKELATLFPNCKITIELNSELKRLTLNLKESKAQIELDRQNRKELLERFKVELAEFNSVDQYMLNESWFDKDSEEKIYIKNTEGKFIEQELSINPSNEEIASQSENEN